jgi:Uma2 family endonuclease
MKAPALPLWKLTRTRYDRMVDAGIFGPEDRVELLDGLLRQEKPVALDDLSEPEPDVVVVRGRLRDFREHPSSPVLIVEVADSSLRLDRVRKGALYARAGIADYWVLNLVDEVLEVYRDPVREPSRGDGWKYSTVRLLERDATISPPAAPRARIRVASLLP